MNHEDLPFFGLWVKDFTASTAHWTDEEVGAYMRLLIHQWNHGEVPSEAKRRARIADSLGETWPVLEAKFPPNSEGRLMNPRLESERGRVTMIRFKASEKARKAAEARWSKDAQASAQAMPEHMHEQSLSNASQNQNQNKSTDEEPEAKPPPPPLADQKGGPESFLDAVWGAYSPEHRGNRTRAEREVFNAWGEIESSGLTVEDVIGNLEAWQACEKWAKGFTPTIANWLKAGNWRERPAVVARAGYTPLEESERIQRILSCAKGTMEREGLDHPGLIQRLESLDDAGEVCAQFVEATGYQPTGELAR